MNTILDRKPRCDLAPRPNDIAEALTGRPYVTYSEVTAFQSCPLKWQFGYVEKAKPEQISAAMLLGTCVHAAIQHHLEARMAVDRQPTLDELMETYRARWESESRDTPIQYARGQDAQALEALARRMIECFLASPQATPTGEIVGIEEGFRVTLAADLPDLSGRVDMIELRGGELVITDFKTARTMWSEDAAEDHAEQLILYAQGGEPIARDMHAKIKLQFVIITKTKEPKVEAIPVEVAPDHIERSKAIIRQVFRAMQSGAIYPAPSPMGCSGCQFQQRCATWHHTQERKP